MKTRACVFALLLACAAGCAIPSSPLGYLENRRQDLIDVVHVDMGAVNIGAVAYVGPFLAGINYQTGTATRTQSDTIQIGLGGPRVLGRKGLAAGVLWPASRWNGQSEIFGPRPKRAPSGLAVGLAAGVGAGIGAEADVLEAADFALGLLCIDICEDDEHVRGIEAAPVPVPIPVPTPVITPGGTLPIPIRLPFPTK